MSTYSITVLTLGVLLAGCTRPQPARNSASQSANASASAGQEQPAAQGPACGSVTCAVGDVCCNPSCSVCTPPDGMCTQQLCMDEAQRSDIDAQTD